MIIFAQKLMSVAQVGSDAELTLIPMLKSSASSNKSLFRVGLWPIKSTSEPEISLGIGLVLAALLEQWPSICVYRLLSEISGSPSDYRWKIEDSQFGVDDWELEGLDENVAIWGYFEAQNNGFHLKLEIEDDAREDDGILELNYDCTTLSEVINQLPILATEIFTWLNGVSSDPQKPYQTLLSVDLHYLKDFLEDIFHWELDYYFELWGQDTNSENVLDSLNGLVEIASDLGSDFGAWIISQSLARFILFDETIWSRWLQSSVNTTVSSLGNYPFVAVMLGTTLFRLGNQLQAFDLLETSLTNHSEYTVLYRTLGNMYSKSHEDMSAIDVYQRAIESGIKSSEIYLQYAGLMDTLAEHQLELKDGTSRVSAAGRPFVERYVLTDAMQTATSMRESCAAYRHIIELDHSNVDALARLVLNLLSLEDHDAPSYFSQLIERDKEGSITSSVIEQLGDSEVKPMIDVLLAAAKKMPHEISIRLNLVRAYLAQGASEKAKHQLNDISMSDVPPQLRATVARLRLSAENADFDIRLGEIQSSLDARGQADSTDIEFLEVAVEKESQFSEGYRLLAASYLSWNESDDALEVLLDGLKTASFNADLLILLAKVLWNAEEHDLAFSYLEQGLTQHRSASLLSLMGRFLFDGGEDEAAKEYLRQAEAENPLDPELSATRIYIANSLISGKQFQK